MTEIRKELLLKDLCARLPYGITIYRITDKSTHRFQYSDITENIDQFSHFLEYSGIENIKPYLRPLSSMTEEERAEYFLLNHRDNDRDDNIILPDEASALIDWLNKKMFDYRGLIPMDLALPATV